MPDDKITYMTGSDLIARAKKDRLAFARMWDGLSEAQMTIRPSVQDDWSVKDLIAHIAWWEYHMADWVTQAVNGETVVRTETVDEANARIFEEKKDLTLAVVLAEFNASFVKVMELVPTLTDEQINDADLVNIEGLALREFLIGDTFGHYGSHWDDLEGYVNQIK